MGLIHAHKYHWTSHFPVNIPFPKMAVVNCLHHQVEADNYFNNLVEVVNCLLYPVEVINKLPNLASFVNDLPHVMEDINDFFHLVELVNDLHYLLEVNNVVLDHGWAKELPVGLHLLHLPLHDDVSHQLLQPGDR